MRGDEEGGNAHSCASVASLLESVVYMEMGQDDGRFCGHSLYGVWA